MPEPLKNMFNQQFAADVAQCVKSIYPDFDTDGFMRHIFDEAWEGRELKARMRHISVALRTFLPLDYRAAIEILRQAAPLLPTKYVFEPLIFPDFVEAYGVEDWEASIPALEQFTQQTSSEGAVRPFIVRYPENMMAQMLAWSTHNNHHVRRLASEGCRPRLPWNMALPAFKKDPSPILPILENLKNDESEYVRRSVANNLNDIAKDNPQVVIEVLREWQQHDTPEMKKLISHALRTLIKAGNPDALALLGVENVVKIAVRDMVVKSETVHYCDSLEFAFTIESLTDVPQNLVIDYVIHFKKANGGLAPKVFKLTKKSLGAGEKLHISKKHPIKPITTRVYYAGEQAVELKINGCLYERRVFVLQLL